MRCLFQRKLLDNLSDINEEVQLSPAWNGLGIQAHVRLQLLTQAFDPGRPPRLLPGRPRDIWSEKTFLG